MRIAYHAFSEEEIVLAGGGGEKERRRREGEDWRRALQAGCGRLRAADVVRVAGAGGVSEEGGPVTKGGTSPRFAEVRRGSFCGRRKFSKKNLASSASVFAQRFVLIRVDKHFTKNQNQNQNSNRLLISF